MIFQKNRPSRNTRPGGETPRGRSSTPEARGSNTLAQRFSAQDEPDTIDLGGSQGFQASCDVEEPDTRSSGNTAARQAPEGGQQALVSIDEGKGKFYVHPGPGETGVLLNDEAVSARTELRKGDRIRIGTMEFEFSETVELL